MALAILISGSSISNPEISATLFLNNGNGDFIEKGNTSFIGVSHASVNFVDIDGDADMDVLITGQEDLLWPSSYIYTWHRQVQCKKKKDKKQWT